MGEMNLPERERKGDKEQTSSLLIWDTTSKVGRPVSYNLIIHQRVSSSFHCSWFQIQLS